MDKSLMYALPAEVLMIILRSLDARDLCALACTCSRYHEFVYRPAVWEPLCRQRWIHPATSLFTRYGKVDWRIMYQEGNGWKMPQFKTSQIAMPTPSAANSIAAQDLLIPRALAWCPRKHVPGGTSCCDDGQLTFYVAFSDTITLYQVPHSASTTQAMESDCLPAASGVQALGHFDQTHTSSQVLCMLGLPEQGPLLAGLSTGGVDVYSGPSASHDPVSHTRDSASAATPATCTLIAPQARSGSAPVVDLMHLGARAGSTLQVCALHDALFLTQVSDFDFPNLFVNETMGNMVCLWDVEQRAVLGEAWDPMDGYEHVAIARAPGSCVGVESQHVLLTGSVSDCCAECFLDHWHYASLCHHKPKARSAAMGVVDARVGLEHVQRFSLGHRSMFPHICVVQDGSPYVCTSHTRAPLQVWDLRQMSYPAAEGRIPNNMPGDALQALRLESFDGDQILGRGEGGFYAWDFNGGMLRETGKWAWTREVKHPTWGEEGEEVIVVPARTFDLPRQTCANCTSVEWTLPMFNDSYLAHPRGLVMFGNNERRHLQSPTGIDNMAFPLIPVVLCQLQHTFEALQSDCPAA